MKKTGSGEIGWCVLRHWQHSLSLGDVVEDVEWLAANVENGSIVGVDSCLSGCGDHGTGVLADRLRFLVVLLSHQHAALHLHML